MTQSTLFGTPHNCKIRTQYKPIYRNMSCFELAARHAIAREHNQTDVCRDIEEAVNKLDNWNTGIIKRLKYYQPIGK